MRNELARTQRPDHVAARVVRVLIADDDPTVRSALTVLVEAEPALSLVGVAADAAEAAALAEQHQPDVALVDVRMPGGGPEAVRAMLGRSPATRAVALSAYGDRASIVGMLAAGAAGYLVKGTLAGEIVATLLRAANGKATLSEEAATSVVSELSEQLQRQEAEVRHWQQRTARIEQALQPGALAIVCQPLVDLRDGLVLGAEALSRFAVEPLRPPDVWFAEAAEVGLGAELELHAVHAALAQLAALPADVFLSVNVSPSTIMAPRFAEVSNHPEADRLVVEVTEHAPVADYDALAAGLRDGRRRGLRLAIDDAGAGYASLQHILRLDPDLIKLDVALTRDIDTDGRRRALAAALIHFAGEIGAVVVAEGIETRDELTALRALGATIGQGYHLGRPSSSPLPTVIDLTVDACDSSTTP